MRLTSVLLVLLAVTTACGGGDITALPSVPSTHPSRGASPVPTHSVPPTPPPVTFTEAAEIAEREGEGRIARLQLYSTQPPIVWLAAVLGRDGALSGLRVHAVTGAVIGRQVEDAEDTAEARRLVAMDRIGVSGMRKAVVKIVPGSWIAAAGLGDDGVVVWEVEAIDPAGMIRKVEVDAVTGAARIIA